MVQQEAVLDTQSMQKSSWCHSKIPVVGDVVDALPHLLRVVAVEVILHCPFVGCFGDPDTSPLVSSAVEATVTRPQGCVSGPEEHADLACLPRVLVWINLHGFIHSEVPNTVFDVVECSLCE